jgi:hypothetical protein
MTVAYNHWLLYDAFIQQGAASEHMFHMCSLGKGVCFNVSSTVGWADGLKRKVCEDQMRNEPTRWNGGTGLVIGKETRER